MPTVRSMTDTGINRQRRLITNARPQRLRASIHQPIYWRRSPRRWVAPAAPTPPGKPPRSTRRKRERWLDDTTPSQRGLLALIMTIAGALIALAAILFPSALEVFKEILPILMLILGFYFGQRTSFDDSERW